MIKHKVDIILHNLALENQFLIQKMGALLLFYRYKLMICQIK